ncbi:hypothetical protein J6590_091517 [Homalodisca vitripennis]|nr:hypothetical protein J6590_091517 [Homalodisca vitripennis]
MAQPRSGASQNYKGRPPRSVKTRALIRKPRRRGGGRGEGSEEKAPTAKKPRHQDDRTEDLGRSGRNPSPSGKDCRAARSPNHHRVFPVQTSHPLSRHRACPDRAARPPKRQHRPTDLQTADAQEYGRQTGGVPNSRPLFC